MIKSSFESNGQGIFVNTFINQTNAWIIFVLLKICQLQEYLYWPAAIYLSSFSTFINLFNKLRNRLGHACNLNSNREFYILVYIAGSYAAGCCPPQFKMMYIHIWKRVFHLCESFNTSGASTVSAPKKYKVFTLFVTPVITWVNYGHSFLSLSGVFY